MTLPNFKLKIVAKQPVCSDATAVIKDSENNTLKTEAIPSGVTENITINDTTVQLKDTANNNIGSVNSYLAESANNLTAPNATVNLNGGAFQTPRSNQTIDVLTRDQNSDVYSPSVSGLTLTFDRYDEVDLFMSRISSTNSTWRSALRTFKAGLITDGIWSKAYYINPVLGGTSGTHAIPLIGATPLTFFGSITHASTGMTGNGTNGYYAIDLTHPVLGQNNHSMFLYLRTNVARDSGDIGYQDGSGNGTVLFPRYADGNFYSRSFSGTADSVANSDSRRVMGLSRTASGSYIVQRDGTQNTFTRSSTTVGYTGTLSTLTNRIIGMNMNVNGTPFGAANAYSTREHAFIWVGEGLTSSEMTALRNRIDTLQTSLGRNV
jgi:hypothetical protein